jgi:hypothetical protein
MFQRALIGIAASFFAVLLASAATVLFGTLIFGSAAFASNEAEWDRRYNDAMNSCIIKAEPNRACVHVVDGNPLLVSPEWSQVRYKAGELSAGFLIGEGTRTISAGMVHFQGDDSPYWKRLNAQYNYESLKRWAKYRADKNGMETCQRACLATCISSRMIQYDNANRITSWRDAIEREAGVCREFSAIAANLMQSLGVKARVLEGKVHSIIDGQAPDYEGGHVMVEVSLPNGKFIMEPQTDSCEFYDKSFSTGKRNLQTQSLNLKM